MKNLIILVEYSQIKLHNEILSFLLKKCLIHKSLCCINSLIQKLLLPVDVNLNYKRISVFVCTYTCAYMSDIILVMLCIFIYVNYLLYAYFAFEKMLSGTCRKDNICSLLTIFYTQSKSFVL